MYPFVSEANYIIQGCVAAIIVGAFYNLWIHTQVYGGVNGLAVRFLGIGMLFVTIAIIERILTGFKIVQLTSNLALVQDAFSLIGLIFLGLGFSKIASGTKV
ncbi:MAG: hypothetical protein A2660_02315 [Candidatus Doudnabacteria bacterium RIFCSPHIGHO2_01_FULL_45_18]|uniref:Uncharacterized protein n=1 Tax=Candidatus Doudnabacteria bacterium RIFCSPHIGHO2_01_FULL_45_18 TaxID=1817823 RepID=A0A1F5NQ93_9BACT|nr:MAG: hypothetical protein A2660_02315 [Candidatus Doudnabacteria bacterium RIFCSPHIGHO2_01_FULL_45_18]